MATFNDDIHSLAESHYSDEVVRKGLSDELDVAVDIVKTSMGVPYVGSVVKLYQVGSSLFSFYHNYSR